MFPYQRRSSAQVRRAIQISGNVLGERRHIYAQLLYQGLRDGAIWSGTLNRECSTISKPKVLSCAKFIALGMSAEVVVIVEYDNGRLRPGDFSVDVGCVQSAVSS